MNSADSSSPTGWNALAPLPGPLELGDYDRHAADDDAVRAQLHRLCDQGVGTGLAWAEFGWPELVSALLAIGRTDVPLSRLVEGHVDALRIHAQAGTVPEAGRLYGVWASRSQQTGVAATVVGSTLRLTGTVRFASGLGVIDRALLPVWTGPSEHRLIDLDLRGLGGPGLRPDTGQWTTAAMEVSRSHTVVLEDVVVDASTQVGPDGFYLDRPQFFPGGVGVAACWLGGAARVADLVQARMRPPVPPALALRLGALRAHLGVGAAVLHTAAERLTVYDTPDGREPDGRPISAEARWAVATAVHAVLDQAQFVAGPAGLAYDRDLTRAVHDLRLYVLQHNPDGELGYLAGLQSPAD